MKSTNIILAFLLMITVSCSDERIVLEKPPVSGEPIGGFSYAWSISQKSSGDYVGIAVTSYIYESTRDRYIRKIYLNEEISGDISSSCVDISEEDWDRVENLVQGVFTTRPDDIHCDCCDETLPYSETLYYIYGIHECMIDSRRIEGCTDENIEAVRGLFKELRESYLPEENIY